MRYPDAYYEELQGRLRGLLITVEDRLPPADVQLVNIMIDANECGLALEHLRAMLVEANAKVSSEVLNAVETLVSLMGLDIGNVESLRPLVEE